MKYIISAVIFLILQACSFKSADLMEVQEAERLVDDAVIYLREGDLERAEANFNLSLELVDSAAAVDGLGCVAFLREEFELAEKLFIEAYDMDETYSNSLGNLALLYEVTGQSDKSSELYNRAMIEDPRNFRMRNNYAVYLTDNNASKEEVFRELYKAQALYDHPLIYDNIKKLQGR